MIIGNVGKDPNVTTIPGGAKIAHITIATTAKYKDRDGNRQEDTEWHDVSCFGQLADVADKYVRKGSMLYVDGRLRTRSYVADGRTVYRTEIVASALQMLNKKVDDRPETQAYNYEDLPL